jgi:hypothetical protein
MLARQTHLGVRRVLLHLHLELNHAHAHRANLDAVHDGVREALAAAELRAGPAVRQLVRVVVVREAVLVDEVELALRVGRAPKVGADGHAVAALPQRVGRVAARAVLRRLRGAPRRRDGDVVVDHAGALGRRAY